MIRVLLTILAAAGTLTLGWRVALRLQEHDARVAGGGGAAPPAPVAVAPVEQGPITLRRTFSGTLEAASEFVVAPKVSGRLERLAVDLGDTVERGQVVARLDDAEYVQAVARSEADLAVARARLAEARSALEIAERTLQRFDSLRERGVTPESQVDAARADALAGRARVEVAQAEVASAESALESARIRLGYTQVVAGWSGGDDQRVVAERFVDEGDTVPPNAELLSIVELDPLIAVVYVPERDYGRLRPGLAASLATDAYPGEAFGGLVERIAPIFRRTTRQVRVEIRVANPGQRLKPGMFVRATVELERVDATTLVPSSALTQRQDEFGVFLVSEDGSTVRWRPVTLGIRGGGYVQVLGEGLSGRVVILGQQLCEDGSAITIPEDDSAAAAGSATGSEAPEQ